MKRLAWAARAAGRAATCRPRLFSAVSEVLPSSSLVLKNDPQLQCNNLFCEFVGRGCSCRLAMWLERSTKGQDGAALRSLDVSSNKLPRLPDIVWQLPKLQSLNAADNELTSLDLPSGSSSIETLDLRRNRLREVPADLWQKLPRLQRLLLEGNPLSANAKAVLAAGVAARSQPSASSSAANANAIFVDVLA
jgi:Leucine-rich repeat (LRR) protein